MKIFISLICSAVILFIICRNDTLSYKEHRHLAEKCAIEGDNLIRKQGFKLSHFGDGNRCNIRSIICGYNTTQYHLTEIEDARSIIVEKVLQFAEPFNKEKRIRMYLHNYPFGPENVHLSLFLVNENNEYLKPPYICLVSNVSGVVRYSKLDPITNDDVVIHKETFENALKLYNEKKLST